MADAVNRTMHRLLAGGASSSDPDRLAVARMPNTVLKNAVVLFAPEALRIMNPDTAQTAAHRIP